ncbi:MAG TPA: biotin/lipoyl-containing protein [Chloroflexota bacterium]|nr:biotin/lipoyl-containing protein [Chloroflexota bacterium]
MSAAPEVRSIRPGLYRVTVGNRSWEVALDMEPGEETIGVAFVDGATVPVRWEDPRRRSLVAAGVSLGARSGSVTIAAPMPGKIVSVAVETGAMVERGQTVIVLEAMKMESAIAAPHAGTVTDILVAVGQPVQQRQAMLRIDSGG